MTEAMMPVTVEQCEAVKLLACASPWCDHAAFVATTDTDLFYGQAFQVQCTQCGMGGPVKRTEAEAIAAWNTRATPPSPAGEVLHGIDVARTRLAPLMKYGEDAVWRPAQFAYEVLGNAQAALTANGSQPDRVVETNGHVVTVLRDDWQDIGTAPKALGAGILAWDQSCVGEPYIASWTKHGWFDGVVMRAPTKWQPLPICPTLDAKDQSNG